MIDARVVAEMHGANKLEEDGRYQFIVFVIHVLRDGSKKVSAGVEIKDRKYMTLFREKLVERRDVWVAVHE